MSDSLFDKVKSLISDGIDIAAFDHHLTLDQKIRHFQPKIKKFDFENDLLNAIKYCIWMYVYGDIENPTNEEPDHILKHKAMGLFLQPRYAIFIEKLKDLQHKIITHVRSELLKRTKSEEHPLMIFFERMLLYKELHIRRVKTSPAKNRVKKDVDYEHIDAYTADTIQVMDYGNEQAYRWMILVPLPSDLNVDQKDPMEDSLTYEMAIAIKTSVEDAALFGDDLIKEPEGPCVTQEMCDVLQFVHNIAHFQLYFHDYVLASIPMVDLPSFIKKVGKAQAISIIKKNLNLFSPKRLPESDDEFFTYIQENIESIPFEFAPLKDYYPTWDELWLMLASEKFYTRTMKRLPKTGDASIPQIITRIGTCRHLMKSMIEFSDSISALRAEMESEEKK